MTMMSADGKYGIYYGIFKIMDVDLGSHFAKFCDYIKFDSKTASTEVLSRFLDLSVQFQPLEIYKETYASFTTHNLPPGFDLERYLNAHAIVYKSLTPDILKYFSPDGSLSPFISPRPPSSLRHSVVAH